MLRNRLAASRMLFELPTSRERYVALPPTARTFSAAWSPLFSSRAVMTTSNPRSASCFAVSNPMPRLAPVISAIRRVALTLIVVLINHCLWTKKRLYRATFIHRSVPFSYLLKRQHEVEYLARVDFPFQNQFN